MKAMDNVVKSKLSLSLPSMEGEIMNGIRVKNGRYYMARKIKGKWHGSSLKARVPEFDIAYKNYVLELDKIERGESAKIKKKKIKAIEYNEKVVRYKGAYDKWILPYFGEMTVQDVTKKVILDYLKSREGMTKSTLTKELRVLKNVIQQVDESFELPKEIVYKNKGKKTVRAATLADVKKVLPFVAKQSEQHGEQYTNVFKLMLYTGLDISDAVYLDWEHVEKRRNRFWIARSRFKSGELFDVPAGPQLTRFLESMRKAKNLEMLESGSLEPGPLFRTGKNSQGINNKGVSSAFKRAFKDAGVKGSAKSLRHFFASYVSAKGRVTDANIGHLLGHASGSKCTKDYIHAYDEDLEQGVDLAFSDVEDL